MHLSFAALLLAASLCPLVTALHVCSLAFSPVPSPSPRSLLSTGATPGDDGAAIDAAWLPSSSSSRLRTPTMLAEPEDDNDDEEVAVLMDRMRKMSDAMLEVVPPILRAVPATAAFALASVQWAGKAAKRVRREMERTEPLLKPAQERAALQQQEAAESAPSPSIPAAADTAAAVPSKPPAKKLNGASTTSKPSTLPAPESEEPLSVTYSIQHIFNGASNGEATTKANGVAKSKANGVKNGVANGIAKRLADSIAEGLSRGLANGSADVPAADTSEAEAAPRTSGDPAPDIYSVQQVKSTGVVPRIPERKVRDDKTAEAPTAPAAPSQPVVEPRTLTGDAAAAVHSISGPLYDEAAMEAEAAASNPFSRGNANPCSVAVVGVGGAGCNALARLPSWLIGGSSDGKEAGTNANAGSSSRRVSLLALNTDEQALVSSAISNRILLGQELLQGRGAGGKPQKGAEAADASAAKVREAMAALGGGVDAPPPNLIFIAAGLGGGTGSGAAPLVAKVAREMGSLTVAVVTTPFAFEGAIRAAAAQAAMNDLLPLVDMLIHVDNDRLAQILPAGTSVADTLYAADEVLRQAILGIASILSSSQLINVDFADLRAIVQDAGLGLVAIGRASGPDRAAEAARAAISSPLIDVRREQVRGLIYAVQGGPDMSLKEVQTIGRILGEMTEDDAQVIFGASSSALLGDEIVVTLVATGFGNGQYPTAAGLLEGVSYDEPEGRRSMSDADAYFEEAMPQATDSLDLFAFRPAQRLEGMKEYGEYLDRRLNDYGTGLSSRRRNARAGPSPRAAVDPPSAEENRSQNSAPSVNDGATKPPGQRIVVRTHRDVSRDAFGESVDHPIHGI